MIKKRQCVADDQKKESAKNRRQRRMRQTPQDRAARDKKRDRFEPWKKLQKTYAIAIPAESCG